MATRGIRSRARGLGQGRPVDLPRRHRVLEREPDAAVNGDLLRVHAPGVCAADDFAEFGADSVRSELRAAYRAHAYGEIAIVTDEDGIADYLRADLAFTGLVETCVPGCSMPGRMNGVRAQVAASTMSAASTAAMTAFVSRSFSDSGKTRRRAKSCGRKQPRNLANEFVPDCFHFWWHRSRHMVQF
jgi:hypothetical protein